MSNIKRMAAVILFFLLGGLLPLAALEVRQGRMKLVLHEGIGRFSLYLLTGESQGGTVPLFVDQDPRTSGSSLVVDNRIYRLGESSEFQEQAEMTAQGARFIWESKKVRVLQEFTFLSNHEDGIILATTIGNLSEYPISAGLRYCIDTYLGEEGLSHFKTDLQQEISAEMTILKTGMPQYWLSPSPKFPSEIGLQCVLKGQGITVPDRVVFANWKRLDEASWFYDTSGTRNFTLLPYSINDSAVGMYYDPVKIEPGSSQRILTVLGNHQEGGFALAPELTQAVQGRPAEGLPSAIRADLNMLNGLLQEIESKLSSPTAISSEDLLLIEKTLSGIKERVQEYSQTR